MSLADKAKEAAKSENAQVRGGWFKFKEGDNKMRVLAEPEVIYEDYNLGMCYTGCNFKGSIKYMTYVWDYADRSIKLWKMPFGLFNYVASLETKEDWQFEGFPMPYDLVIGADGAGTKEVKYTPTPRPVRTEMPAEVLADLKKRKPLSEIIDAMKKKNEEAHKADGTWERLHTEGSETTTTQRKASKPQEDEKDGIEYPTEDINPDDIPF